MTNAPNQHPDSADLSPTKRALLALKDLQGRLDALEQARSEPIAIVGMGCRFPGAADLEAFWQMLSEGRDGIGPVPPERWDSAALYSPDPSAPGTVICREGGFLEQIDRFDADFFGIAPREAVHIDPRQRLVLEVACEALADAGAALEGLAGSAAGVFMATTTDDYNKLLSNDPAALQLYSGTGGANSIIANRISYLLDLRGPSIALDTACSGSLQAIHLACQSLRGGESSLALAGGVSLNLLPDVDIIFSRAELLAPGGRCRTFDQGAEGIVRSEGVGVVVLKRLRDALADGDRIYALIRGGAANQDGRSNGLMAPNRQAQVAVLRAAYEQAGVAPAQVQYVEAHGTGTRLGDPIEVSALTEVLGQGRDPQRSCVIGSVKTNIGHTEAAAGVAGVIKVALALSRGLLPPNLHFTRINPLIAQPDFPLVVPQTPLAWPHPDGPLLAGVSSFGFGGSNTHLVLEQAPAPPAAAPPVAERAWLLPLSARSPAALQETARRYRDFLAGPGAELALREICASAALRRSHHGRRAAVVGESHAALIDALAELAAGEQPEPAPASKLVFAFSGQGALWPAMGRDLLEHAPAFRSTVERCAELVQREAGWALVPVLSDPDQGGRLQQFDVAQIAVFALQLGLAEQWRAWGVTPSLVVGQSLGEVAAACFAGALDLETALRLVICRGRLYREVAGSGRTALVGLPWPQIRAQLNGFSARISMAGNSGPASTVIAGDPEAVAYVCDELGRQGVFCRPLEHLDVALHSHHMEPLRARLERDLAELRPRATSVAFMSSVTGQIMRGEDLDAAYWGRHLREPFLFADASAALVAQGYRAFVEISPHPALTGALQQTLQQQGRTGAALPSLRRGDGHATMLHSLGALYTQGFNPNWAALHPERCAPVALPHYPWQRERYWIEQAPRRAAPQPVAEGHPLLGAYTAAGGGGGHYWQIDLSAAALPYLADHQVQGTLVLPGAFYLELARAAGQQLIPEDLQVEDVEFAHLLTLDTGERRQLQIALTPLAGAGFRFEVYSRPADAPQAAWRHHAGGVVRPSGAAALPSADLARLQADCARPLPVAEHYDLMRARGLEYGPAFQGLRALWSGEREGLGLLAPQAVGADAQRYWLHPALLDAAFQVTSAALAPLHDADTRAALYLPEGVGALRPRATSGAAVWVHARLHPGAKPGDPTISTDVLLLDADGAVLGEVRDFRLRRVGSGQASAAATLLYEIAWQPAGLPPAETLEPGGLWLICADAGPLGRELARRLVAEGQRPLLIGRGQIPGSADCPVFSIDPTGDTLPELLRNILAAHPEPPQGLIYLWGVDAALPDDARRADLERAYQRGVAPLLTCVQTLARLGQDRHPRLWIVTRAAQALGGESANPLQGMLWGLARTIAREHAELWGGLLDLAPTPEPDEAAAIRALLRTTPATRPDLALRGGRCHQPQLRAAEPAAPTPPRFRPDASYLITGGLSGLGLEAARWMVAHGARRLILIARQELPPRSAWAALPPAHPAAARVAAVRDLERQGVAVHTFSLDVADEQALERFLTRFRDEGYPPIAGVIHSAGVSEPGLLLQLDDAAVQRVLAPKVYGAWALHRLTRGQPLDCFILFSSIISVFGQYGQAHYSAANAFLDTLAHTRRSQGLPALSINWGPWAEVGIYARGLEQGQTLESQSGQNVFQPITVRQGQAILGLAAGAEQAQLAALSADWSAIAPQPICAELTGAAAPARQPAADDLFQQLAQADPGQRAGILEQHLRHAAALVLRIDPARVSPHTPLTHLGMDSIMAVELKSVVERRFGLSLALVDLLSGSIHQLAERAEGQLRQPPAQMGIPRAERPLEGASFPLAPAQERIWFDHTRTPELPLYNEGLALHLRGPLQIEALERAFNDLAARHSVLRTRFSSTAAGLRQTVLPRLTLRLALIDLTHTPADLREDAALKLATAQAERPFALDQPPLLDQQLIRLGADDHLLALTIHHIVIDGWGLGMLVEELFALYRAALSRQAALPAPALQYVDVALWQREQIRQGRYQDQLRYWREALTPPPPPLTLPGSSSRAGLLDLRGRRRSFVLPADLLDDLRALARAEGSTLFALLLAAFQVLLHRYTGQTELAVGVPATNRSQAPELSRLIGVLINTIVLRATVTPELPFRDLLARVRQTVLEGQQHQDAPLDLVIEAVQPARERGSTPLFQAMFDLQKFTDLDLGEAGLQVTPLALDTGTAKFDLTLSLRDTSVGLLGELEYRTDLFSAAAADRLVDHFLTLLRAAVARIDRPVGQLDLLPPAERGRLLELGAGARAPAATEGCVHRLVERSAAQRPGALALADGAREVSYGELNRRANQLARLLRRRGAGPGERVCTVAPRSIELVVGQLAALKAGAAFVPLDPAHPPERIGSMLRDARPAAVLTLGTQAAPALALPEGALLIDLADRAQWADEDDRDLGLAAAPDDLAYVIYTSGSTGQPKGVMIPHSGLLNLIAWQRHAFAVGPDDRASLLAGVGFDAAVWELWPYLASGAALLLAPPDLIHAPERLRDWLVAQRATISFVPTPVAEELLALDWPARCALRAVLTGGDRLRQAPPPGLPFTLFNNYGPTEYSVVTTSGLIAPAESGAEAPSLGRPIAGTQVYILDGAMQPAPVGVPGELYVGGAGLARGYLGRPDLTAERFVPNPFAADERRTTNDQAGVEQELSSASVRSTALPLQRSSARLYRTGDLACFREDGTVAFLGRIDAQIKIRGVRIEPGEIERALLRLPEVREALVSVWDDPAAGAKHLVAYIVPANQGSATDNRRLAAPDEGRTTKDEGLGISPNPRGDRSESGSAATTGADRADFVLRLPSLVPAPAAEETTRAEDGGFVLRPPSFVAALRAHLAALLPEQMVPAFYVPLERLPLTPNGKVDYRALPAPARADRPAQTSAPPSSAAERRLAAIWSGLLGVPEPGIDDSFFELGGHSLLITRMVAQVAEAFGVDLPLGLVFQSPTIRGVAAQIAAALRPEAAGRPALPEGLVALREGGAGAPLFCAPPASGSPLCYVGLAQHLGDDRPIYGFQMPGLDDDAPPLHRVEDMAAAFIQTMRAVQPEGPYLICGWSLGGLIALEMARQLARQGQRAARLVLIDPDLQRSSRLRDSARLAVFFPALLAFAARAGMFSSYQGFQQVARWVGLSLPASLDELPRRDLRARARLLAALGVDGLRSGRVFLANIEALRRYTPAPCDAPLLLFHTGAAATSDQAIRAAQQLAPRGLEIHQAPGTHMTLLLDAQIVRQFAAQLRGALRAPQEPHAILTDHIPEPERDISVDPMVCQGGIQ